MTFVERRFELDGRELLARFSMPERAPGGEFRCDWMLRWPDGREDTGDAPGEDSVQALMLAMRFIHDTLVITDAYKNGRLTLWGQSDLDLPPTWAVGPLYDGRHGTAGPAG